MAEFNKYATGAAIKKLRCEKKDIARGPERSGGDSEKPPCHDRKRQKAGKFRDDMENLICVQCSPQRARAAH